MRLNAPADRILQMASYRIFYITSRLSTPNLKQVTSTDGGCTACTRAVVKPYGVENEINHAKNIYELTIPDTLMPIENPTGHLPRVHRRCFFGGVQYGPFRINPRL